VLNSLNHRHFRWNVFCCIPIYKIYLYLNYGYFIEQKLIFNNKKKYFLLKL